MAVLAPGEGISVFLLSALRILAAAFTKRFSGLLFGFYKHWPGSVCAVL